MTPRYFPYICPPGTRSRTAVSPRTFETRKAFFISDFVLYIVLFRLFSGGKPIQESDKESAAHNVPQAHPKQIVTKAHPGHVGCVVHEKRNRQQGHVGDTVFKAARDKSEKTPEDQNTLCRVTFSAPRRPKSQTNKPITQTITARQIFL